jgi:hypothetical protein
MKVSFYLLIIVVIIACLALSYKYNQQIISEKFADVPAIPVIKSIKYENNSVLVNWDKPISADPIINYFIFINKLDENKEGVYLHLVSDSKCTSCSYTINNLNLLPNTNYYVSVMAINKNGASAPSANFNFNTTSPSSTLTPASTLTPSSTLTPTSTLTPSSTLTPTLTLEDSIRMMQNERKSYLDSELQNMIIRADGIYEVDKTELAYPDIYLNDVKQSINTINDTVKKDLQEYRLNIHVASQKNN